MNRKGTKMATIYPRPVFNYTLPEEFYQPSHARPGHHFRPPPPNYDEAVPRSVTVNPQQLFRSLPLSPPVDSYEVPSGSYHSGSQRHMMDRDQMDYVPTSASSERRPITDPTALLGGRHRTMSYSLDTHSRLDGRRPSRSSLSSSPTSPNDLLTPPLSPASGVASTYPPSYASLSSTLPTYTPHSSDNNNIANPLTRPTPTTTAARFYCPHPNCQDPTSKTSTKSFSRRADLQRHHACTHQLHAPIFSCPKHNCGRKGDNGFTRMDHLIEHRRGYHGENIPKRGTRRASSTSGSGKQRSRSGSGSGSGSDRERRRS